MKGILRKILVALAVCVILLQFVRPPRNISGNATVAEITTVLSVPVEVQEVLHTSCYDCHSNTTRYPWYAEIQPIGWWLNSHIQDARRELNFSEFARYRLRRQFVKLQQVIDEVNDNEMPLPSYLIIHSEARLSLAQKERLTLWANSAKDSMRKMYPADSLERRMK
jgi:hypothetical protein